MFPRIYGFALESILQPENDRWPASMTTSCKGGYQTSEANGISANSTVVVGGFAIAIARIHGFRIHLPFVANRRRLFRSVFAASASKRVGSSRVSLYCKNKGEVVRITLELVTLTAGTVCAFPSSYNFHFIFYLIYFRFFLQLPSAYLARKISPMIYEKSFFQIPCIQSRRAWKPFNLS